jgi:hypothetical protein
MKKTMLPLAANQPGEIMLDGSEILPILDELTVQELAEVSGGTIGVPLTNGRWAFPDESTWRMGFPASHHSK